MFFKHFLLPHVSASRGIIADLTRVRLFRHVMKHMGDDILIRSGVIIKNPENISIGSRVSIQENCYLSGWGGITIGNHATLGNGTKIVSSDPRYARGGGDSKPTISRSSRFDKKQCLDWNGCIYIGRHPYRGRRNRRRWLSRKGHARVQRHLCRCPCQEDKGCLSGALTWL